MRDRLVIIGAGGHGRMVADCALKIGYTDVAFADDNAVGEIMNIPIICKVSDIDKQNDGRTDFVIAVGSNAVRKMIAEAHRVNWCTLVHPSAQIGTGVKLGVGTVVMANAVVNPCAIVGCHCIINTGAIVEHDNVIGDYVHISPNVALGGSVSIGERTHVGIGATLRNNIAVCGDCTIGAGAVVAKDITESATYVGVPAKMQSKG